MLQENYGMTKLKRLEAKYVRDGIKSKYPSKTECYISGETEKIQLHHYNSVTLLWNNWKKQNGIQINTIDDILKHREQFYIDHQFELLEDVVFLTDFWHNERLHKIYGICPPLHTAKKQKRWVDIQREKYYGMD